MNRESGVAEASIGQPEEAPLATEYTLEELDRDIWLATRETPGLRHRRFLDRVGAEAFGRLIKRSLDAPTDLK